MNLSPYFTDRSHNPGLQPSIPWKVISCTWSTQAGGCETALLRAAVPRLNPAELASLLRCGVELVDEAGSTAWWGMIHTITIRQGGTGALLSLENLANRVRAAYQHTSPAQNGGGVRAITTWADHPASQAAFGIKERQLNLALSTPAQAEQYRAAELAARALPRALPLFLENESGACRVELTACGWFATLDWKYYASAAGLVEYTAEGIGIQALGETTANTRLAQSFSVPCGGWNACEAWFLMRKNGSPADSLQLQLHADAAGAPGAVLDSVTLPAASLPGDYTWVRFPMSGAVLMQTGAAYWLALSRSGAADAVNHYRFRVNESIGFPGGVLRLWGGSAWAPRSPDADLLFRAAGGSETTAQAAAAASAAQGGQFLSGVRIDSPSGMYTNPHRIGDRTCLQEINSHLAAGTAAGAVLLPFVTRERVLVLYQQPAENTCLFTLDHEGVLRSAAGSEVNGAQAAILPGQWANLETVWSGQAPETAFDSRRFVLQRLRWDAHNRHLRAI